ncbi:hypothetical protein VTJ49DRAFT_548 [Mycothermus thermophilus]|uniref:SMP-LTD domain-containing protein n=1 Tax=Humicola insolens TaxID=85995 RepID=A0ABR3VF14_HUMIN
MGWTAFLLAYFLGGITFLPLLVLAIFAHAYLTLPYRPDAEPSRSSDADDLVQPGDDLEPLKAAQKESAKSRSVHHEQNVAAGYFAVCREYTPMGINAKPIERSTPVGSATVAAPSPSVYQTMYRSIFDRKQTPGPLDSRNGASQRPKKAGNVFYVVLRHGHLMLFDDDEQLEVRHVVSLAHHDVSVYSGEDVTPEGELWIKRNAICLSRRTSGPEIGPDTQISKPFYLFSENCSAKEDFYFALLRNQEETVTAQSRAPTPIQFDVKNIISLVQKLHSSEEHMQTRWLNALIGRVFLAIHKTQDIENFIRQKLTKKISRVKRPSFLSNISIKAIDTGDAAPYFMNPRLKDLSIEGECCIEAGVRYTGNFRLEVAATARIDLGSRFKAREVNLVLAVVLRKLEGHALFRIKPPPSNRIWFSFQQMPKIEMTIEPIVSSRQITYTLILRQIENRIKEVIAETIVLPFWDDTPFFNTEHKKWRGGIFHEETVKPPADREPAAAQEGDSDEVERLEETQAPQDSDVPHLEKSHSTPVLEKKPSVSLFGKKLKHKTSGAELASSSSSSTSVELKTETKTETKSTASSPPTIAVPFAQPSSPTVGTIATNAEHFRPSSSPPDRSSAAAAMATLSGTHLPASPASPSPATTSNAFRPYVTSKSSNHSSSSSSRDATDNEKDGDKMPQSRRNTASSMESNSETNSAGPSINSSATIRSQNGSISRGLFGRRDTASSTSSSLTSQSTTNESTKRTALLAVANAAASAKRWGLNAFQRRNNDNSAGRIADGSPTLDLSQPMGRGHPLPPPGTPLPMPERITPIPIAHVPKRKPVTPVSVTPPAPANNKPPEPATSASAGEQQQQQPSQPSPLPKRRQFQREQDQAGGGEQQSTLLVVAAPMVDSEPTTPLSGTHSPAYAASWVAGDAEPPSANMATVGIADVSLKRSDSPPEAGTGASVAEEGDASSMADAPSSVAIAAPAVTASDAPSSTSSSSSVAPGGVTAEPAEGDTAVKPEGVAAAGTTESPTDNNEEDEDYSAWIDDTTEADGVIAEAGSTARHASSADVLTPVKG